MRFFWFLVFILFFQYLHARESYRSLADTLFAKGEYDELLNIDDSKITDPFAKSYIFYKQGLVYLTQSRFEDAAALFERSVSLDVSNMNAFYYKAYALYKCGEVNKASEDLVSLLEKDSTYVEAWITLGICRMYEKKYAASKEAFIRALEWVPTMPVIWYNYGILFEEMQNADSAIFCFENALAIDSSYYFGWWGMGDVYFTKGDYSNALLSYEHVLKNEVKDALLFFKIAQCSEELKAHSNALGYLDSCSVLDSCYSGVYLAKGEIYCELEDYNQGVLALNKAIVCDPNDANAYRLRGLCYSRMGDTEHALSDWERSNEIKSGTVSLDDLRVLKIQDFVVRRGVYVLVGAMMLLVLLVAVVWMIIRRKN